MRVPREFNAAVLSSMNCKVHLCKSVGCHLEEACCLGVRTALEVASLAGVDRLQTAWGANSRTEQTDFRLAALLLACQGLIRTRTGPPTLHI